MQFKLMPLIILEGNYPSSSEDFRFFALSEHSRGNLDISYEPYEKSVQLANGQTRKYVVTKKCRLKISWSDLPSVATATVDNGAGGRDLERFYDINYNNEIGIYVYSDRGTGTAISDDLSMSANGAVGTMPDNTNLSLSFTGYIDSFDYNIKKRYYGDGTRDGGYYEMWDVNMSLMQA